MEEFDFWNFLTLKSIFFLKNKVSLNEYFFLIQQVFSQGVTWLEIQAKNFSIYSTILLLLLLIEESPPFIWRC